MAGFMFPFEMDITHHKSSLMLNPAPGYTRIRVAVNESLAILQLPTLLMSNSPACKLGGQSSEKWAN